VKWETVVRFIARDLPWVVLAVLLGLPMLRYYAPVP
jgi:hypothetical protein